MRWSRVLQRGEGLVVTARCKEQVGKLKGSVLRVGVEVGGCGGFQYRFALEPSPSPQDTLLADGRVVVDPVSLPYLDGAVLDYQDSLMRSGYSIIQNPLADSSCGCGVSFTPKDLQ